MSISFFKVTSRTRNFTIKLCFKFDKKKSFKCPTLSLFKEPHMNLGNLRDAVAIILNYDIVVKAFELQLR